MTMSLGAWILSYLGDLLFCLWILRWGGAERLEGTLASGFLISWLAPRWEAEGIKLFVLLSFVLTTGWFLVGLFVPEARMSW
jgi:hypothetical protein